MGRTLLGSSVKPPAGAPPASIPEASAPPALGARDAGDPDPRRRRSSGVEFSLDEANRLSSDFAQQAPSPLVSSFRKTAPAEAAAVPAGEGAVRRAKVATPLGAFSPAALDAVARAAPHGSSLGPPPSGPPAYDPAAFSGGGYGAGIGSDDPRDLSPAEQALIFETGGDGGRGRAKTTAGMIRYTVELNYSGLPKDAFRGNLSGLDLVVSRDGAAVRVAGFNPMHGSTACLPPQASGEISVGDNVVAADGVRLAGLPQDQVGPTLEAAVRKSVREKRPVALELEMGDAS